MSLPVCETSINDGGNTKVKMDVARSETKAFYSVEERPTPILSFLFGIQQAILCLGGGLSIPFLLANLLCAENNNDARAQFFSITMFMCGIATILQSTFGVRLGIVQGGSHTFISPIIVMMTLDQWKCPDLSIGNNGTSIDREEVWQIRMREVQGNIILASITQVVVGATGLVGFLIRFIGPLTIAPTIALIGLSLTGVAAEFSAIHWGISSLTAGLILIFTLFLGRINVPCPAVSKSRGCYVTKFPLFQLLPVILSVAISWLLCYILTVTDTFPSATNSTSYNARTDARLTVVQSTPWFFFPYPCMFGMPTFSAAGYVGMLAATLSSIIESIGDYYACARISNAAPPPPHAINRGIAMEGFASILSGLLGAGHATTSYSNNIGAIGITKVASRVVIQIAGVILLIGGILGKIGAVLSIIPDPIIGGTLIIGLGMVVPVGISTLQFVDMSSSRNLTIIAISFFVGLMLPQWLAQHPDAFNTGSKDLDQMLTVMLGTAMFVGGVVGFILDNIAPGSEEERGLLKWQENSYSDKCGNSVAGSEVKYDIPIFTKWIKKIRCCIYCPMSPTYEGVVNARCTCKSSKTAAITKSEATQDQYEINGVDSINARM